MARASELRLDPSRYEGFIDIPVLYGDLDPNWHVNNVSMGRFFEHGRVMAHETLHLNAGGRMHFLVARVTIDYVTEGKLGTPISVGSRLARVGNTSLTIEQIGLQGDRCVALCETVLVRVEDGAPTPLPVELREFAASIGIV